MNNKPDGVITELLPLAEGEELREFVQQQADADVSFAVKLSQWLTKQYGAFITESSVYVDEVRRFSTLPGAKILADVMVTNLRVAYMRRPAYIDELNKL